MTNSNLGRDRARTHVADEMVRQGLGPYELARRAGVDQGTVADFVSGARWPIAASRNKIATALGWVPEAIDMLVRGEDPTPADGATETVGAADQDSRVLLDIDREVYEAMDPISRRRAKAEAEALFYRIAQEARRRADER